MSQPPPPAPPPPSGDQAASGVGQPADLLNRFLAKLIDFILLMIVNFIIVTTLIFGVLVSAGMGRGGGFMPFGGFSIGGLIASVVTAVIYVGYFAFMESSKGQTVGKMLLKLEVRGPDGNKPSMEVAIKRNIWMALSIVPFIGGLAQLVVAIVIAVTINNSATNTGWHDQFAGGTSVIKIG